MHPWEPLRGGHVRVSELMGKTWRLIIGSCITHHTVAMSECIPASHHPLKHNARTRISNSHVQYVPHCCRDRSCHRATPQASQPSPQCATIPKSLSMSITIASISRPNSSQTQKSFSRALGLSVRPIHVNAAWPYHGPQKHQQGKRPVCS